MSVKEDQSQESQTGSPNIIADIKMNIHQKLLLLKITDMETDKILLRKKLWDFGRKLSTSDFKQTLWI